MSYKPYNTEIAEKLLRSADNFFVYGDPDTDGIVATYLVLDYLRQADKHYTYYINTNREHGFKLTDDVLLKLRGCTIIAVDFHMSREEVQRVVDNGINIVVMDHHELESAAESIECKNAELGTIGCVICNQYSFEPAEWKFLSGAGVVNSVFTTICTSWETQKHKALVGITLLSDSCPIETKEAQEYLDAVYTWRDAESARLIRAVQTEKQRRSMFGVQKYLDRDFLDYTFNPTFNALCRFNKMYIALDILLNNNTDVTDVGYYKAEQTTIREYLYDNSKLTEYEGFTVCALEIQYLMDKGVNYANFIGLLANKLLTELKTTIIIYITDNGNFVRGSVRGVCDTVDYLALFKKHGILCDGHMGAFGLLHVPSDECLNVLSKDVYTYEEQARASGATTRKYINVYNLQQMLLVDKQTVRYNQYVRDAYRTYYVYKGNNWQKEKENDAGTYVLYNIDGISVKSFNNTLTPENSAILPMMSNGYAVYTLCAL